ncbi:MAG: S24/S26 family peptidase [Vicinamibacteria bacterium]|nr:S24/S26 family peptidase [Vicinamibacteria bacterium]
MRKDLTPETRRAGAMHDDAGEVDDPRAINADSLQTAEYLRQCLADFARVRLRVTGTCMRPVLAPGDDVELVSAARRHPFMGDVVLVRHAAGLRLHRLVWGPPFAGAHRAWRTASGRGVVDAPLRSEDVLATVVSIERDRRINAAPRRGWMIVVLLSLVREGPLRLWRRIMRRRQTDEHEP